MSDKKKVIIYFGRDAKTFAANIFTVEQGHLYVKYNSAVVAVYAPGAWESAKVKEDV